MKALFLVVLLGCRTLPEPGPDAGAMKAPTLDASQDLDAALGAPDAAVEPWPVCAEACAEGQTCGLLNDPPTDTLACLDIGPSGDCQPCRLTTDCGAGLFCIGSRVTEATCQALCDGDHPCAEGTCVHVVGNYGFCQKRC